MKILQTYLFVAFIFLALILITGCSQMEGPTAPEEIGEQSLLKSGDDDDDDGNLYQAVAAPGITWSDARTAAAAMKRRGCVGHLATITSQEENDFIAGTFPEAVAGGYWLGGFQPPGSVEPGGGWEWITGEPFIFTNWADGEPNDTRGDENALHFFPPFFGGGTRAPGTWNDQNEDNSANLGPEGAFDIGGYVVEFNCDDDDDVPDISAAPTRVDFGQVDVGSSKDKTFVLKNDGTADLKINKKQVAGSNAEQYEVLDLDVPAVLAPGESRDVTVRFSPTSSGIKKGQVKLFSNDPDENPFPVSFKGTGIGDDDGDDGDAAPDISAAPTRVDFGQVDVGSSKDKTFVLKNGGTADLEINRKQVAGSSAEQYEIVDLDVPAVLAPGESREVTVRFSPTSSGIKKGHVKLFSNDPDENPFSVSFKGTGIGGTPDISAAPTRVDFGQVDVGSSKDKTFVLKNDGTGDLKIEKKQVAGSNAEQYEVLDLDVPVVLAPGESREVTVRFSPTSSGIKKGQVKLFSNDPDENPFPVSFKGTGIDDH